MSDISAGATTVTGVDQIQRRTLRVLSSAQVLGTLAVAGAIPAGSLIAASVAHSEAVAGLAQTSGVVGAAVIALPLPRLALSRGRRQALVLGYGAGSVGAVVVTIGAITGAIVVVLLGCLLVGMASAAGLQARYAAVDLASADKRARSLALVVWAGTIGAVIGPNLLSASGNLALRLQLPQLTGPYIVAGVTLAGATILLFTMLRPDPYAVSVALQPADTSTPRPTIRLSAGIAHLRREPRALLGMVIVAVGHAAMVAVMVMTPVHMRHVDVSLTLIGLVISVHVLGMYAFSPIVGWAADRWGRIPVAAAGVFILLAACAIAGFSPADNAIMLGWGLFLLGLGWSCTLVAGSTLLTESVSTIDRPAVQGIADLSMNVSGAVAGIIAGIVVAVWSYGALCAVTAGFVVALGIIMRIPATRRSRSFE